MERSTNTLDAAAEAAGVAANEGTKTGAEERKDGTNSAAAGLNENSGASTLRDRKGFVGCGAGAGATVRRVEASAAGAEDVRMRGGRGSSSSTAAAWLGLECSP